MYVNGRFGPRFTGGFNGQESHDRRKFAQNTGNDAEKEG
jgi:hypothetical protein